MRFPLAVGASYLVLSNLTSPSGSFPGERFVDIINRSEISVPAGTFEAFEIRLNEEDTYGFSPAAENFVRVEPGLGIVSVLTAMRLAMEPGEVVVRVLVVATILGSTVASSWAPPGWLGDAGRSPTSPGRRRLPSTRRRAAQGPATARGLPVMPRHQFWGPSRPRGRTHTP
jgi:hypothetical protein